MDVIAVLIRQRMTCLLQAPQRVVTLKDDDNAISNVPHYCNESKLQSISSCNDLELGTSYILFFCVRPATITKDYQLGESRLMRSSAEPLITRHSLTSRRFESIQHGSQHAVTIMNTSNCGLSFSFSLPAMTRRLQFTRHQKSLIVQAAQAKVQPMFQGVLYTNIDVLHSWYVSAGNGIVFFVVYSKHMTVTRHGSHLSAKIRCCSCKTRHLF